MTFQEPYDPNCCVCQGSCSHTGPHNYCGRHFISALCLIKKINDEAEEKLNEK